MAGPLAVIGAKIAAEAVGESIEATGRIAAGAAVGAGHALSGAFQGIGSAIGGTAKGIGEALGGALQGAMTPPDTVINNIGIVGNMGKQNVKGASSVLSIKTPSKPSVNTSLPSNKLLGIAVSYLSSIQNTLKSQLAFDVKESKRLAAEARENNIESVGKSGLVSDELIQKDSAGKKNPLKSFNTALIAGGLLAGGFALYNNIGKDDIANAQRIIDTFVSRVSQVWDTLSDIIAKIGYWYDKIFDGDSATFAASALNPAMLVPHAAMGIAKHYWGKDDKAEIPEQKSSMEATPVSGETVSGTQKRKPSGVTDNIMLLIHDEFKKYGVTDEAAKTLVAEIGRETSFNQNSIFGTWADTNRKNSGIFSWTLDRRTELINFLKSKGFVNKDGTMIRSDDTIRAQVAFAMKELSTKKQYRKSYDAIRDPSLGYLDLERIIGTNYIGWAYNGNSKGFTKNDAQRAKNRQREWYSKVSSIASASAGAASAGIGVIASAGSNAITSMQDSFSNDNADASEEKKEPISISGKIKSIWDAISDFVAFDTEYKPFVASAKNDSTDINKKSTEASANEIAGLQKALSQTLNASNDNHFERALRTASGGTLEVINPNYSLSSDNVVTKYLEFFELLK